MRIRIVSDGSGRDTNVYAVGDDGTKVLIRGVQAVEWSVPHPRGRAEAKLTVLADVDVEAELTEWRPQPRDPTLLEEAPEHEVPGWLVGLLAGAAGAAVAIAAALAILGVHA